jgi:hypothetical protein
MPALSRASFPKQVWRGLIGFEVLRLSPLSLLSGQAHGIQSRDDAEDELGRQFPNIFEAKAPPVRATSPLLAFLSPQSFLDPERPGRFACDGRGTQRPAYALAQLPTRPFARAP